MLGSLLKESTPISESTHLHFIAIINAQSWLVHSVKCVLNARSRRFFLAFFLQIFDFNFSCFFPIFPSLFRNYFQQKTTTACLVSFATETVMQLCHGRRRCTISADTTTFGNPCRPDSRMYLKTVYTCGEFLTFVFIYTIKNVDPKNWTQKKTHQHTTIIRL